MQSISAILLLTALYFGAILALVVYGRYKETKSIVPTLDEFFLAGKNLHPLILAGTFIASYFSTWTVLGLPGQVYAQGVGALYFVFILDIVGVFVLFWIGPKIRNYTRKNKIFSPVEIISKSYNSRTLGLYIAILFAVFLMPYISLQLVGVGSFIEGYSGGQISYLTGVGSMMFIVLVYLFLGGMRAVAYTDIIQMVAILIGMGFGFFYLLDHYDLSIGPIVGEALNGNPDVLSVPGPTGLWTVSMLISVGLVSVGIHFQPHLLTRSMMAKSESDFKIIIPSILISRALTSIFTIGFAIIAFRTLGNSLEPNLMMGSIFEVMSQAGTWGLILSGLMLMGALGAAMSTADSLLISIGQVCTRDIVRPYLKTHPKKQVLLSKGVMLFVLLTAFIAGFNPPKIMVDLGVYSGAGCALLIPTILSFSWKRRSKLAAYVSITFSLMALIGFAVYKMTTGTALFGVHPGFIPLILSFTLYYAICFLERRKINQ